MKKRTHSLLLHLGLYGEVYVILIATFSVAFVFCFVTVSLPVYGVVRVLSEIGVGLLSFGGVIFAILFQEPRNVATSLSVESRRLKDEFDRSSGVVERASITRSKASVDDALSRVAVIYLRVRSGFLISFVCLGIELFATVSMLWVNPDRLTFSLILSVLGASIAELIYGILRSGSLPIGLDAK